MSDPWQEAYIEANKSRFELARRVGYLEGSIKEIARYLEYGDPKFAAEMLRTALVEVKTAEARREVLDGAL